MMYVVQIVVFFATLYWSFTELHAQDLGLAPVFMSVVAAFVVTALIQLAIDGTRSLARGFARVFRLKDKPADEISSLPPPARHVRNALEDRRRFRIGQDLR